MEIHGWSWMLLVNVTSMKVPFTLGTVGHFGLAVTSPKRSAKWFERALGLSVEFEYEDGIAVGNKNVTIALFKGKPSPETIGHMSFHLPGMTILRKALEHLKELGSRSKIRVTKSGRKLAALRTWAFGSMILMVTVGSSRSSAAHGKSSAVNVSPESSEILLNRRKPSSTGLTPPSLIHPLVEAYECSRRSLPTRNSGALAAKCLMRCSGERALSWRSRP